MKGPKGPMVEESVDVKDEKMSTGIYITLILMVFIISFGCFHLGKHNQKMNTKPEIIYEKGADIIRYVDITPPQTETKDFLFFLNKNIDPQIADIVSKSVNESSEKYGLPRKLICAIMMKESSLNPFAKSGAGAVGLMQIMPEIHKKKVNGRNPYHIDVNIDVGCSIFREYLDREKGDLNKTFHRYLSLNAKKSEVIAYRDKIFGFWAELEMFDHTAMIRSLQNLSQPVEPGLQS